MADQLEEQEKNREKDLEEGEIDELEEGEIEDELNVISGYHFSARDEKLGSENDVQIERDISLSKSKSFTHNQRNLSRNTKHSRERDGRRTDPHLSRGYEKVGRKRSGGRQNISGRRRDELLRGNRKYRTRDVESWGTEDGILYEGLVKMKVKSHISKTSYYAVQIVAAKSNAAMEFRKRRCERCLCVVCDVINLMIIRHRSHLETCLSGTFPVKNHFSVLVNVSASKYM